MKKFFKGLLITLVVVIVLPIALVFIFLFDTSKMNVKYDENFVSENWSKNMVVDSLDYTASEKQAKFIVTESDINNMIRSSFKDNKEVNKYLTQFAIDIQDDAYVLNVSGKAFFFETRAKMTTKLSKEKVISADNPEGKDAFVLSVDKIALGRLNHLKVVINFILTRFLNNDTIDALMSPLKIHSDLKNSRLFIYTEDLRKMINDNVNSGSGTQEFYFSFINDFLDSGMVNIDFYGGESLTVAINLEPLTGNDYDATAGENVYYPMNYDETATKLTIDGQEKKLSLDTIRDALVSLIDNQVITLQDASRVSEYLFKGYVGNGYSAPDFNLNSIGILNKETYPGFALVGTDVNIDEIVREGVKTFPDYDPGVNTFEIADLKESQINAYLKSQGIFGHKYFLDREVSSGHSKINYIALDNAYMNFFDKSTILSLGMNINGLETIITLKMKLDETNIDKKKLIYYPEKVYFGKESKNQELSKDTKDLIFDTLAHSVVEASSVRFGSDGKMTISFDGFINQAINSITANPAYKYFLQNDADLSVKVDGNAVTDNASIKIVATRH